MAITYPVRPYAVTRAEYTSSVRSILESLIYSNILLQKKSKKIASHHNETHGQIIFLKIHVIITAFMWVYMVLCLRNLRHFQMNELINVTNSTCAKLKHIPDRAVYSQGAFYISFFCKSLHKQQQGCLKEKKKPYPKLSYPFKI